jgi:hypothetical protein
MSEGELSAMSNGDSLGKGDAASCLLPSPILPYPSVCTYTRAVESDIGISQTQSWTAQRFAHLYRDAKPVLVEWCALDPQTVRGLRFQAPSKTDSSASTSASPRERSEASVLSLRCAIVGTSGPVTAVHTSGTGNDRYAGSSARTNLGCGCAFLASAPANPIGRDPAPY